MLFNSNLNPVSGVSIALITVFFLAACGEKPQEQTDKKAQGGGTPQVVTGNVAPSDPLGPRYQATLSEGIAFNRAGYPGFVSSVKGIANKDPEGVWTDGTRAIIEFTQALPKTFTLKIKAAPFAPTMGKPIKIIIGATQLETNFNKAEVTEIVIPVATDGNARSVIFEFPDPKSPKELGQSTDPRRLSLYLISLKIE